MERLKLADFGWSIAQRTNAQRTTLCGTPEYLPPEVCKSECYGTPFDMYTVGVLLYEMLVGYSPFAGQTEEENQLQAIQSRIVAGNIRFPGGGSVGPGFTALGSSSSSLSLSPGAKQLILALMSRDPEARPSAVDVLNDPWVVKFAGPTPQGEWDR